MLKRISILLVFCFFVFLGTAKAQIGEEQNIKILSKPRPSYTDKARKRNVSGWVRLRVTFEANGEIGDVVYVAESSKKKKLTRDGLVTQAIAAARKIKFEPATKVGQPITVTKLIEYNFNLY